MKNIFRSKKMHQTFAIVAGFSSATAMILAAEATYRQPHRDLASQKKQTQKQKNQVSKKKAITADDVKNYIRSNPSLRDKESLDYNIAPLATLEIKNPDLFRKLIEIFPDMGRDYLLSFPEREAELTRKFPNEMVNVKRYIVQYFKHHDLNDPFTAEDESGGVPIIPEPLRTTKPVQTTRPQVVVSPSSNSNTQRPTVVVTPSVTPTSKPSVRPSVTPPTRVVVTPSTRPSTSPTVKPSTRPTSTPSTSASTSRPTATTAVNPIAARSVEIPTDLSVDDPRLKVELPMSIPLNGYQVDTIETIEYAADGSYDLKYDYAEITSPHAKACARITYHRFMEFLDTNGKALGLKELDGPTGIYVQVNDVDALSVADRLSLTPSRASIDYYNPSSDENSRFKGGRINIHVFAKKGECEIPQVSDLLDFAKNLQKNIKDSAILPATDSPNGSTSSSSAR